MSSASSAIACGIKEDEGLDGGNSDEFELQKRDILETSLAKALAKTQDILACVQIESLAEINDKIRETCVRYDQFCGEANAVSSSSSSSSNGESKRQKVIHHNRSINILQEYLVNEQDRLDSFEKVFKKAQYKLLRIAVEKDKRLAEYGKLHKKV